MNLASCPSCGFNLSEVYPLYKKSWDEITKINYTVTTLLEHKDIRKESGKLLDILQINNECCRTFIITEYTMFSPFCEK